MLKNGERSNGYSAIEQYKEKTVAYSQQIGSQLSDRLSSLNTQAQPLVRGAEDIIRKHPGACLAASASVGILLAVLLRKLR